MNYRETVPIAGTFPTIGCEPPTGTRVGCGIPGPKEKGRPFQGAHSWKLHALGVAELLLAGSSEPDDLHPIVRVIAPMNSQIAAFGRMKRGTDGIHESHIRPRVLAGDIDIPVHVPQRVPSGFLSPSINQLSEVLVAFTNNEILLSSPDWRHLFASRRRNGRLCSCWASFCSSGA